MARRKPQPPEKRRPQKKKVSILTSENITYVDYKDVDLLRRFMSERAKIRARRVTGNSAQQQREVARAIRVAREMALLPYAVRQVTTRRGSRRDREREPRTDTPTATPPPPPPPSPDAGEGATAVSEALQPEASPQSPDTEAPDTEAPGTEAPGTEAPGTESPAPGAAPPEGDRA